LGTITDPFSGNLTSLERVSIELGVLTLSFKKFAPKALKPGRLVLLETASPSFKVSWAGYIHDYLSLAVRQLDIPLKVILKASNSLFLLNMINIIESITRNQGLYNLYNLTGLKSSFYK
jgi:hypothetical protein